MAGTDHRQPVFRFASRIVWPPASVPPASRTFDAAPSNTAASVSLGSSSGNAAIDSAKRTRPPIANTSLSAFAAAISPNVRGVIDERRKEVERADDREVVRDPVGRARRRVASGRPSSSSGGASAPVEPLTPGPSEASARRSAPSFAAHPPQSVSSVRRIGGRVSRAAIGR